MRRRPREGIRILTPRILSSIRAAIFAAAAFGALSCRTAPPPIPEVHPAAALPRGRDLYFSLDMEKNRGFLERVLVELGAASRGTEYFLRRSRFVYGAADLSSGGGPAFFLAARGDYSRSLVEFGIRSEEGWEERSLSLTGGSVRYYRGSSGNIELAVPSDRLLLAASSGVEEGLLRLYRPDEAVLSPGLLERFEAHGSAFYVPDPKGGVLLRAAGILPTAASLEEVLLFADPGDSVYDLSGSLELREEGEAKAFSALLRLFFSGILAQEGLLLSEIRRMLKIEARGTSVSFSGLSLSEGRLAAFLRSMVKKGGDGGNP